MSTRPVKIIAVYPFTVESLKHLPKPLPGMFTVADFIILIILLFFTLQGLFRGLLLEIFSLLAIVAGTLAAVNYYSFATAWFESIFPPGPSLYAASYTAVFLLAWLAVKVMGWVLNKNMGHPETKPFSRLAGGVLGLAKSVIFVSLTVFMVESAFPGNKITGHNYSTKYCIDIAHRLQDIIPIPAIPDLGNLPD